MEFVVDGTELGEGSIFSHNGWNRGAWWRPAWPVAWLAGSGFDQNIQTAGIKTSTPHFLYRTFSCITPPLCFSLLSCSAETHRARWTWTTRTRLAPPRSMHSTTDRRGNVSAPQLGCIASPLAVESDTDCRPALRPVLQQPVPRPLLLVVQVWPEHPVPLPCAAAAPGAQV